MILEGIKTGYLLLLREGVTRVNKSVQVIFIYLLAAALAIPHKGLKSAVLFFQGCDVGVASSILML
jgi:hypothetical protein